MEQGLVPQAADRDAAQFLDSHRHGRGIRLGVARVGLVRKGGEPLVAADPGPRPEAPMRSHRPPILLLRCQHVILCCDGALRRPQPRRGTTNEAQRTAASRDLAPMTLGSLYSMAARATPHPGSARRARAHAHNCGIAAQSLRTTRHRIAASNASIKTSAAPCLEQWPHPGPCMPRPVSEASSPDAIGAF